MGYQFHFPFEVGGHYLIYCSLPLYRGPSFELACMSNEIPSTLVWIYKVMQSILSQALLLSVKILKLCHLSQYCQTCLLIFAGPGGDMQWCFSQVKGAIDDDVAEGMSSAKNYL